MAVTSGKRMLMTSVSFENLSPHDDDNDGALVVAKRAKLELNASFKGDKENLPSKTAQEYCGFWCQYESCIAERDSAKKLVASLYPKEVSYFDDPNPYEKEPGYEPTDPSRPDRRAYSRSWNESRTVRYKKRQAEIAERNAHKNYDAAAWMTEMTRDERRRNLQDLRDKELRDAGNGYELDDDLITVENETSEDEDEDETSEDEDENETSEEEDEVEDETSEEQDEDEGNNEDVQDIQGQDREE